MHPSAQKVAAAAKDLGLDITIVEFSETTRTAGDAANAIGCQVAQIVKSLLFLVDSHAVMTLVSGANRLDDRKLAGIFSVGRKKVKRADAEKVKALTGFSIGGVPPIGHFKDFPIYVDEDLLQFEVVWAAAGTPHAVFAISPDVLIAASGSVAADLKVDEL